MAKRADVLEFAVLGLLQDNPMHGYELRKRLNGVLGTFRAISYGSLYPMPEGFAAPGPHRRGHDRSHRRCSSPDRAPGQGRLPAHRRRQGTTGRSSTTAVRRRGRTTGSAFTSRSSAAPTPTSGCASCKAGDPASRSAWPPCASR